MSRPEQWQLEGDAAQLYQRHLVPAMTAMWAVDLADRARLRRGERVLDVACGTGVVAREAASRVGSEGGVAAIDLNPGMLAVARSLAEVSGASIDWLEGSALALPFADAAFDVVACQLGLQFFADRHAALCEMRRVLTSTGRLALNVYGPIERNPATHALAAALDQHVGDGASTVKRAEHALGDRDELRALVASAGFDDIVIETETKTVRFPSASDYVAIQLAATPLASLFGEHAGREGIVDDVGAALSRYLGDDGLAFPQEVHVVLARR